jgi:putative phosphoesterase
MRIVVLSDTHGRFSAFENIVNANTEAELFIHLGDNEKEVDKMRLMYSEIKLLNVAGNCDFYSPSPIEAEIICEDKRIFYTHGHTYNVKHSTDHIVFKAKQKKADILLFGHTHTAYTSYDDGLYIMNPGSPSSPREGRPSYGVIDITKAGIFLNIINI